MVGKGQGREQLDRGGRGIKPQTVLQVRLSLGFRGQGAGRLGSGG